MDALHETWRLLRPGGWLVDLRPIPELSRLEWHGHGARRFLGQIAEQDRCAGPRAAEVAVRVSVSAGAFRLEHAETYEFRTYYDSLDDLQHYIATSWRGANLSARQVERIRQLYARHPDGVLVVRGTDKGSRLAKGQLEEAHASM